MTSIYRNMKKLAVQRDQYIDSIDGRLYSRAAAKNYYRPCRSALEGRQRRVYTAAEIRAERVQAEQWERDHTAWINSFRRTQRPIKPGSLMWTARKTPDRSVRRMQRKAAQDECVRLLTALTAREALAA